MRFLVALFGMAGAFAIVKYREMIGDMVGGRYIWTVAVGVALFFWSLAYLVGAEDIFFRPLLWILPGVRG